MLGQQEVCSAIPSCRAFFSVSVNQLITLDMFVPNRCPKKYPCMFYSTIL